MAPGSCMPCLQSPTLSPHVQQPVQPFSPLPIPWAGPVIPWCPWKACAWDGMVAMRLFVHVCTRDGRGAWRANVACVASADFRHRGLPRAPRGPFPKGVAPPMRFCLLLSPRCRPRNSRRAAGAFRTGLTSRRFHLQGNPGTSIARSGVGSVRRSTSWRPHEAPGFCGLPSVPSLSRGVSCCAWWWTVWSRPAIKH